MDIEKSYRFASAVAMFGSLLRSSSFVKEIDWNTILLLANASADPADLLQKEFISLVEQAKGLYSKNKKKKKKSDE